MPTVALSALRFTSAEIAEVAELYASNPDYCRAAGEYDPAAIPADRLAADLRAESDVEGGEVLLARDERGRLVGLLCLLDRNPADGRPWIGLLMVHGGVRRRGLGRRLAALAEQRFRARGEDGVRLAVLENTPSSLAFWRALGWGEVDRRPDRQGGRPCVVMHKALG